MRGLCVAWIDGNRHCDQPAKPYAAGPYCDQHAPWRQHGHTPPTPDPQWTAEAFRARVKVRPEPEPLPDCTHGDPQGARYCALCRHARKANL